jgi:hypothetical protein
MTKTGCGLHFTERQTVRFVTMQSVRPAHFAKTAIELPTANPEPLLRLTRLTLFDQSRQ